MLKNVKHWQIEKRVGSAEAQRITTESANIGTVIHAMIESYIQVKIILKFNFKRALSTSSYR